MPGVDDDRFGVVQAVLLDPQVAMQDPPRQDGRDALLVLLPLLIVLSTFLFLLLLFLISLVILRRRRGISLGDHNGPVDMSREDLVQGEGGFEGVESRWLESVSENERRNYLRAKDFQTQYPPNSAQTDITLSQFLSIQEKGVSAWSFDPDYEMISSLLVHARTELTFLPDPASATSVQSNLPLPKLNEVYYWEVKMFDLPETTNVAIGLATKPFPAFRLPGHARYSVAYHSNGDKSHNYPFTNASYSAMLKEGDVLGIGYRPRSGTLFFTRNGRKLEDAFVGLGSWNLFPTIGADGPCSLHVNLGQGGFVFIEANVKKWGLAPSVGTLAPPPAYGSERGSILLESGMTPGSVDSTHSASRRMRRSRPNQRHAAAQAASSPLRNSTSNPTSPPPPLTPPPAITPIDEEAPQPSGSSSEPSRQGRYISPTDLPFHSPNNGHIPASPTPGHAHGHGHTRSLSSTSSIAAGANPFVPARRRPSPPAHPTLRPDQELSPVPRPAPLLPPDSPLSPGNNPPTPNPMDVRLQAISRMPRPHPDEQDEDEDDGQLGEGGALERRDVSVGPPEYSPLDAYTYRDGVSLDLPAEMIGAALERGVIPGDMVPAGNSTSGGRRRSRRSGGDREQRRAARNRDSRDT
ncbi:SPRY-domain-containing protein [Peniophora sp. CONT]|nr:SPRY-domain-containing protein [Peniophora sp. CONT]